MAQRGVVTDVAAYVRIEQVPRVCVGAAIGPKAVCISERKKFSQPQDANGLRCDGAAVSPHRAAQRRSPLELPESAQSSEGLPSTSFTNDGASPIIIIARNDLEQERISSISNTDEMAARIYSRSDFCHVARCERGRPYEGPRCSAAHV